MAGLHIVGQEVAEIVVKPDGLKEVVARGIVVHALVGFQPDLLLAVQGLADKPHMTRYGLVVEGLRQFVELGEGI